MAVSLENYTGSPRARKYHSVTFFVQPNLNDLYTAICNAAEGIEIESTKFYNTWDTWHLIPKTRPVIAPPSMKSNVVDIPGSDDPLDLSYTLTSYATYNRRSGSISFYVENYFKPWDELYSEIMSKVQGKKLNIILNDDPMYYYEGKVQVSGWSSDKERSTITFTYDLSPYKMYIFGSTDDVIWDLYNLDIGVDYGDKKIGVKLINNVPTIINPVETIGGDFKNISVSRPLTSSTGSYDTYTFTFGKHHMMKPVNPDIGITTSASSGTTYPGVLIRVENSENRFYPQVEDLFFASSGGVHPYFKDPRYIFSGIYEYDKVLVKLRGYGTVTFKFKWGAL